MSINEIKKMYKNCNIKKYRLLDRDNKLKWVYPPFTAEKQIELIKWLLQNKRLCIRKAEHSNNFYMDTLSSRLDGVDNKDFEQCLASLVNRIWQDLTKEEKAEIKRILE